MANIRGVAGKAKYVLSGKNIEDAKRNVIGSMTDFRNNMEVNKQYLETEVKRLKRRLRSTGKPFDPKEVEKVKRKYDFLEKVQKEAKKSLRKSKRELAKERLKTYGARTGVGVGAIGVPAYKLYKHGKKKEQSAYNVTSEDNDSKLLNETHNDIKAKVKKGAKIGGNVGALGAGLYGAYKSKGDITRASKYMLGGLAAGSSLGAGAGAIKAINNGKKKERALYNNQSKTAYEIVVDAFEKMA